MEGLCAIALVFLQILSFLRIGKSTGTFDCASVCFGTFRITSNPSCEILSSAADCYYDHFDECSASLEIISYGNQVEDKIRELGCAGTGTPPTASQLCPNVPDVYPTNPSEAVMQPAFAQMDLSSSCTMPQSSSLQQCSLFMDSQLRAFSGYRGGIETCSIPGTWDLLMHKDLSIQVEGTNMEQGSNHTRLTRINVTFHEHSCNPEARSYIAQSSEPLPPDFNPPVSPSSSFSLMLSDYNGTVVSLQAIWLNTTIIIRQYASFLSITIQVPEEVSLASTGLCTGCPPHMYINITEFNNQIPNACPDDNERALVNCFRHGGVSNQVDLMGIKNNSYLDACVYNMYKIRSFEVLSMFNAIAEDATFLTHVVIRPIPNTTPTRNQGNHTSSSSTTSNPVSSSTFLVPSTLHAYLILLVCLYTAVL